MFYDEYQNHKWARNLAHARRLLAAGRVETFYRGEDLPDGDVYPGMRVIAAYWVSVEHEMPLRLPVPAAGRRASGMGARRGRPGGDTGLFRPVPGRHARAGGQGIHCALPADRRTGRPGAGHAHGLGRDDTRVAGGDGSAAARRTAARRAGRGLVRLLPAQRRQLQPLPDPGRRVARPGWCTRTGRMRWRPRWTPPAEDFMWEVSRAFFANVLPAAGFEDIGDLMELGLRGMYADQYYRAGAEREAGEATIRQSILKNCELAGIYWRVAEWSGLPRLGARLRHLPLLRGARPGHDDDHHAAHGVAQLLPHAVAGDGRPALRLRADHRSRRRHAAHSDGAGEGVRGGRIRSRNQFLVRQRSWRRNLVSQPWHKEDFACHPMKEVMNSLPTHLQARKGQGLEPGHPVRPGGPGAVEVDADDPGRHGERGRGRDQAAQAGHQRQQRAHRADVHRRGARR